jgi:hypothetical protein
VVNINLSSLSVQVFSGLYIGSGTVCLLHHSKNSPEGKPIYTPPVDTVPSITICINLHKCRHHLNVTALLKGTRSDSQRMPNVNCVIATKDAALANMNLGENTQQSEGI